jgi:group I intron endonuclease
MVYIYSLNCPITNNPKYIGKSVNIKDRLYKHLKEDKGNLKCMWIKSLKNKGLKPTIEQIDAVPESEWQFWEQYYISLFKSWGFELKNGDLGGLGGGRMLRETKDKISKSHKERLKDRTKSSMYGKKHTPETLKKMSDNSFWKHNGDLLKGDKNPNFNNKWTEEQKLNASGENNPMYNKGYLLAGEKNGMYGKKHKPELVEKMKIAMKGMGNNNYRQISAEVLSKMIELYELGYSYVYIAKEVGENKNKVRRELILNKVKKGSKL